MSNGKSDRLDVYLVAGGKYHNIDFARLELLKLIAEQPRLRVQVGPDYADIDAICATNSNSHHVHGIRFGLRGTR